MQLEAKPFVPDGIDISNLMFPGNGSTWNFTPVEGLMCLWMWLSLLSYMNKKHVNLKKYLCSQSRVQKWGNYLHNQAEKVCLYSKNYFKSTPFFLFNNFFNRFIYLFHFSNVEKALRNYLLTWGVNVCVFNCRCVLSLCLGVWGSGWNLCALALSIINHWPHDHMPEVTVTLPPHWCAPATSVITAMIIEYVIIITVCLFFF